MTKKVLYIGGFELPDKNAAAHRVLNNAKALRELGYESIFVGFDKELNVGCQKKIFNNFLSYNFSYPSTTVNWLKYIIKFDFYKDLITLHDIDIVIVYNLPAFSIRRLQKYCNKRGLKIYADCTEWYNISNEISIKNLIKKIDVNLRMKVFHKKLDGVISISEYLNNFYKKNNIKSVKIPPLVDINDQLWNLKESVNSASKIKFVYVGSPFSIGKENYVKDRLDVIVNALYKNFNLNKKFVLNIVGVTRVDFLKVYPDLEKKVYEMENFIIFNGRLSHKDSISILKESDFSIFFRDLNLANQAGFPTKFVESVSAATAVITNNSSNISDYLINSKNGFILEEISSQSVEQIIDLVFDLSKGDLEYIKEYTYKNRNFFHYQKFKDRFSKLIH
ncbi:glycosyltransferase [Mesonia mobilis]|uniref:glycosyltransferase n=1 Tax=Mesonia mobilis TaxID=369791 RepID=UPI0026F34E29|nr:glycosyltransferase [Mesonia mobilis]